MSEFDDVIKEDQPPAPEQEVRSENRGPKPQGKSLVEMLTEDGDLNSLGKQLNLDNDMTEKVLVPLVNFLDKYGVGETLSTNDTVNRGANLMGFVSDVAPILRSATEYFQGKRNELSDEDEAFLDRIKEAQNFDSMSLFVGESVDDEEEEEEIYEAQEPMPIPSNPFTDGPVDWNQMLGVSETNSQQYSSIAESKPQNNPTITGLERLAAESGLTMDQVTQNDRQRRTNKGGSGSSVDYTDETAVGNLAFGGMNEIQAAMKKEQKQIANKSKVLFEGEQLKTPTSVSDYQPNTTPVPALPTIEGLESLEQMMARQGIEEFEERQVMTSDEEEVEMFEEDEMKFMPASNSYINLRTGDEYEAMPLTAVPEGYMTLPEPIDVGANDEEHFEEVVVIPPTSVEKVSELREINNTSDEWGDLGTTPLEEEEVIEAEIVEEPFFEIDDLSVSELKGELKKLGLKISGRKDELRNRLSEATSDEEQNELEE